VDFYQEMYGQDADGNRGELRNEYEIKDITVTEIDADKGAVISKELMDRIDDWVNGRDMYEHVDDNEVDWELDR